MIDPNRRKILKYASVACLATSEGTVTLLKPGVVYAADWNKALFENPRADEVLSGVSNGVNEIIPSGDIVLKAPDVPENPYVMPVEVTSNITGTTRIILVVEQNTFPLVADFKLLNGAQSYISTRIRLDYSIYNTMNFDVRAIIHANGKVYGAVKHVHVRIGEGDTM